MKYLVVFITGYIGALIPKALGAVAASWSLECIVAFYIALIILSLYFILEGIRDKLRKK